MDVRFLLPSFATRSKRRTESERRALKAMAHAVWKEKLVSVRMRECVRGRVRVYSRASPLSS